jgi:DNA-binding NarL/FixJ family response regulator
LVSAVLPRPRQFESRASSTHKVTPSTGHRTPREREIVQLIAQGKINKQVADMLDISVKTVETHRAAVMNKLYINNTAELVRFAIRNDIVQP